jgi:hypothetical protein
MISLHMECSRGGARTVDYVVHYAWVIQMLFVWNILLFFIVTIGSCLMITRSGIKEMSFARTQSLLRVHPSV